MTSVALRLIPNHLKFLIARIWIVDSRAPETDGGVIVDDAY